MQTIAISQIKPYPENAKKHPDRQVKQIAASIKEFGFLQPIVVDKDMVIIAGHGRYEAALYLQLAEVPVMIVDLSEAQARAYRLADNKLNESPWDMDLVIAELAKLEAPMVELTGFSVRLGTKTTDEDDIPSAPVVPKTKTGDVYQLGPHRIVCGDATSAEDMTKLVDGRPVDLLLTDPPYGVKYVGKTKDAMTIQNDDITGDNLRLFMRDFAQVALAVMKEGAVFYIWHADSEGYAVRGGVLDAGLQVRQCLIWNKNTMVMGRQDYHWKHEPCLYGWKDGASHLWNADRTQVTVLNFDRPSRSEDHPTMKPVELFAYLIGNNTKGQDIVLDPFLGSGTSLIASEKLGRVCYGLELDPKYVDVIVQRYVDFTGKEQVILNGQPVAWPKKNA